VNLDLNSTAVAASAEGGTVSRLQIVALAYWTSFSVQLAVYLSLANPANQDVSPDAVTLWAVVCSVLSVIPGFTAALLRRVTGRGAMLLGASVGLAVFFGSIYLPRLLIPKGSRLWDLLYFS
jgi:hypothetical protein